MSSESVKIARIKARQETQENVTDLIRMALTNPLIESIIWSAFVAYMTQKNQERIASQSGLDFSFIEGVAEWTVGEAVIACQQLAQGGLVKDWVSSGSAGTLPGLIRKIV